MGVSVSGECKCMRVVPGWMNRAIANVQMRKKRKVSSVMGWLLSRQLNEPGAGSCCAFSMVLCALFVSVVLLGYDPRRGKISFTSTRWLSQGRVGDRRFEGALVETGWELRLPRTS